MSRLKKTGWKKLLGVAKTTSAPRTGRRGKQLTLFEMICPTCRANAGLPDAKPTKRKGGGR